jgi:hypothetical protein
MATNDRKTYEDEYGCYPYEEMKRVHDLQRSGKYPETPEPTTVEKLMRPQTKDPDA